MPSLKIVDATILRLLDDPVPVRVPDGAHHDRHVHNTHELSDDATEASTRVLIRVVPMVYGALLGALADHPIPGLLAGFTLTLALDLRMGPDSLFRPIVGPVVDRLGPRIGASVARAKIWGRRRGLIPRSGYGLG